MVSVKNISFIIEYFLPEIGGLENSTFRLATWLARLGHKVGIITKRIDQSPEHEIVNGFTVRRFREESSRDSFVHLADRHGLLTPADFVCVFGVGHDLNLNFLDPVLGMKAFKGIKIGTQGDLNKVSAKEKIRRFDAIFCQNEAILQEAVANGIPAHKCYPVKNGIDIKEWKRDLPSRNHARALLDIPEDFFVLCTVSRLVKRKKIGTLISLFKKIRNTKTLCIIHGSDFGQHDGEEKMLQEIAYGCDQIRFVPPLVSPVVTYAASDIFASFAEREGAPNSILEAITSGLPCILSDISGHRVYVKEDYNGFILDGDCEKKFINSIESLFEKGLRNTMSKNSIARSLEFDIAETSKLYLNPVINAK